MRFPEWLYKLLPGDRGSQQLGVLWREAASTQNAATVGITVYTVPADKCLVLTNMTTTGEATGVTLQRMRMMADPPEGNVRYNFFDRWTAFGAGTYGSNVWTGEVIIPGGWKIRAENNYSAAAATNTVTGEIHGYLIPRGTFVFG